MLVIGYYFGQRQTQTQLNAPGVQIVDPATVELPTGLIDSAQSAPGEPPAAPWHLITLMQTTDPACTDLLQHWLQVFNRLAVAARIRDNLRLLVLTVDQPVATDLAAWLNVLPGTQATPIDANGELVAALGLEPPGNLWCSPMQAHAALLDPQHRVRARIAYASPVQTAQTLRGIIERLGD